MTGGNPPLVNGQTGMNPGQFVGFTPNGFNPNVMPNVPSPILGTL